MAATLRREGGFALVEVMVSALLLVTLALATIPLLDQSGKRAAANRGRGVAASLAQADQDRLRQMVVDRLANYAATATKTVDGTTYTIASRADWVRDGTGFVTCSTDTTRSEYLKTQTTITWPGMNGIKPLVVESIVAPGVAALGPTRGTVTVKLLKGNNTGQPGVTVNLGSMTQVTDAGGCALFAQVPAGDQTLTYNASGYVDPSGDQMHSEVINVAGGQTNNVTKYYDIAGIAPVTFLDQGGLTAPWYAISVKSSGPDFPSPLTFPKVASTTKVAGFNLALFPYTSPVYNYGFYAGDCVGNDPRNYQAAYAEPQRALTPGNTAPAASVLLREYKIEVYNSTGGALGSAGTYRISPDTSQASMVDCAVPIPRVNGNLGATNKATFDLPYGYWKLCVDLGGTKKVDIPITNTPWTGTSSPTPNPTYLNNPSNQTAAADKLAGRIRLPASGSTACSATT